MNAQGPPHKARWLSAISGIGLGLLVWCGLVSPSRAAPNANIGLRAHILNSPNSITDLSASPVGSQDGDIQLIWTAPSNDNGAAIDRYLIRFATFPAASAAQAEAWWTGAAGTEQTIGPAFAPGTTEFKVLTGFTLGVTTYFGIKSIDTDNSISPIDARVGTVNQAASLPLQGVGPPPTPANFAGVALSTESIQWTWDVASSATNYVLRDYPSAALVAQTTNTVLVETSLLPNRPISRTIEAENANGTSAPTGPQTVYTLAAIPTNVSFSLVGSTSVSLSWLANGNPAGTLYRLERSIDDVAYVGVSTATSLSRTDSGLVQLTTYYYRVRAINGDGLVTSPTASVSTVTAILGDIIAPQAPLGLKASVDPSHTAFTFTWEPPTLNEDETILTDLAGYHIYKRTTLRGPAVKLTTAPITITAFADRVDGKTFYYTVRAVDINGNESDESFIADSSSLANVIYLAPDDKSTVYMPSAVNDVMRTDYNQHNEALYMRFEEMPVPSQTQIVRNIKISMTLGFSTTTVEDVAFDKPLASINVGYNEVGGFVAVGSPKVASAGVQAVTGATPQQLSLWWNNGVTWIKVGGALDQIEQVLKTNSSFVGEFQLRIQASATSLTLGRNNVFPRTFTPNGDGYNDQVFFVLENPNSSDVTGEIIDMKGRHVATLPPPATDSGIGTTLSWNGRDSAGSVVPSGVYLYRIKGEGKTFTGTVVVAR